MDNFEPTPQKKFELRGSLLWNILTVVALVGALCLGGYFLSVFVNPNSTLNPFPPVSSPTLNAFFTPTITPLGLTPTWTPTATIQPSPTRTEAPTWTPFPTNTPFLMATLPGQKPPRTATPTATVKTAWPMTISYSYQSSSVYHPDAVCNWMSVAGKAVDKNNAPIMYLRILLGGTLNGQKVEYLTLTGIAPDYGQSGFEFHPDEWNVPVASSGTMWIQVQDQSGTPLTDVRYFDTYDNCEKNIVLFIFKRTK